MAHSGSEEDVCDSQPCHFLPNDDETKDPKVTSARTPTVRAAGHLWEPLRLSRAQIFASNTSRSLSLSKSLSIFQSAQSTDQMERVKSGPGAEVTSASHAACDRSGYGTKTAEIEHGVDTDYNDQGAHSTTDTGSESLANTGCSTQGSSQAPRSSEPVNTPPVKAKCLTLIDKIWKQSLDQSLDSIKHRKHGIHPRGVHMTEGCTTADCLHCEQVKNAVLSTVDQQVNMDLNDAVSSGNVPLGIVTPTLLIERGPMPASNVVNSQCAQNANERVGTDKPQKHESATRDCQSFDCEMSSSPMPPPFKKARFSWQVKNKLRADNVPDCLNPGNRFSADQNPDTVVGGLTDTLNADVALDFLPDPTTCSADTQDPHAACSHNAIISEQESDVMTDNPSTPESVDAQVSDSSEFSPQGSPKAKQRPVKKLEPSPRQARTCRPETTPRRPERLSTEVYPTGHRRSNSRDFQMLTQALTRLDYVERWQCQHVAKALVDNAINKTLEEMGLSPDENSNRAGYREQRTRIEDAGVSQAILSRGLRRYSPSSYRMRRLNPIINRLTRVSEHLFSDNLRGSLRSMNEAAAAADPGDGDADQDEDTRLDMVPLMSEMFDFREANPHREDATSALPEPNLLMGSTGEYCKVTDLMQSSTRSNVNACQDLNQTQSADTTAEISKGSDPDPEPDPFTQLGDSNDAVYGADDSRGCPSPDVSTDISATLITEPCDEHLDGCGDAPRSDPSSNFILDQAVNAVIFERGLQF